MDGVAVIVIEQKDVVVASAGGDGEFSCLVTVDLAMGGSCCSKTPVGPVIGLFRNWEGIQVWCIHGASCCRVRWVERWWSRGRGLLVLAGLVKAAFGCGNGLRRMLCKTGSGEAWEVMDEFLAEGLGKGGQCGTE